MNKGDALCLQTTCMMQRFEFRMMPVAENMHSTGTNDEDTDK